MAIGNTNRSPLFARFQGGSLVISDINQVPASVYFVCSTTVGATDSTSFGRTPDAPFKTISYALSQMGNDDILFICPFHSETFTGGAVTLTGTGQRLIALGKGNRRPQISFGDASSPLTIGVGQALLDGFIFIGTSFAAVAKCLSLNATGITVRNCRFQLANATNQAVLGIEASSGTSFLTIEDCLFHGTTDAGTTAAISLLGGDSQTIRRNVFLGAYGSGVGAIRNITVASTNLTIADCAIVNGTGSSTKAITVLAGTTGMIRRCDLSILFGTAPLTAAGMASGSNYYTATIGPGAGTLI